MSTRINVTVGDGGLLDRNAQQTAANRQARVLADQRATAEAEGVERRAADRTAAGLDPLTGLPASTPFSASTINRLDQEPAANRRDRGLVYVLRFPVAPEWSRRVSTFIPESTTDYVCGPIDTEQVSDCFGLPTGTVIQRSRPSFTRTQIEATPSVLNNQSRQLDSYIRVPETTRGDGSTVGVTGPLQDPLYVDSGGGFFNSPYIRLSNDWDNDPGFFSVEFPAKYILEENVEFRTSIQPKVYSRKAFNAVTVEIEAIAFVGKFAPGALGIDISVSLTSPPLPDTPTTEYGFAAFVDSIDVNDANEGTVLGVFAGKFVGNVLVSFVEERIFFPFPSLVSLANVWAQASFVAVDKNLKIYVNGSEVHSLNFDFEIPVAKYDVKFSGNVAGLDGSFTAQATPCGFSAIRVSGFARYKENYTPTRINVL
jgi:hypothetical protein